jgi:ABC-2 type transport system ATP-binding protein
MEVMHPKFSRDKAQSFLDETEIVPERLVKQLSKGMITQLHLALAISIDARLLVLDEPTLGLDILYRKKFYEQLSNDYFDESKTILITTHQVEEVENLLTDLIFIKNGKLILNAPMEQVAETFVEIEVRTENLEQARSLNPLSERAALGATVMLFENVDRTQLESLGTFRTPSITDLFVAKMSR